MFRSMLVVCLLALSGCRDRDPSADDSGPSPSGPSVKINTSVSCPDDYKACGDRCFDVANDPDHCGGCDKRCQGDTHCANKQCAAGALHCDREHGCGSDALYCSLNTSSCVFGCIVDSQCPTPYVCEPTTKQCAPADWKPDSKPSGPTGATGPSGPTAPSGPTGATGPDDPLAVDIIVVLDNSGSMWTEQGFLQSQVSQLVQGLGESDYHLTVVTGDLSGATSNPGAWLGFTMFTPDNVATLGDMLADNDDFGEPEQHLLLALRVALTSLGDPVAATLANTDHVKTPLSGMRDSAFYRPSARLAVLIVSDGDDSEVDLTLASTYANELRHFKDDVRVAVVADDTITGPSCDESAVDPGTPRLGVFRDTLQEQAQWFAICSPDYYLAARFLVAKDSAR